MYIKQGIITIILILGLAGLAIGQGIQFRHDFAPTSAYVTPQEHPYRDAICLNGTWKFAPVKGADTLSHQQLKHPVWSAHLHWAKTPIRIPSPWNVNSFAKGDGGDFRTFPSYPSVWNHIKAGWLKRTFRIKDGWGNKRIMLNFKAIDGFAQIYVNGHVVGHDFDPFLPVSMDITKYVHPHKPNTVMVWVANANLFNQPGKYGRRIYVGGSFWGQHIVGIWQDVYVVARPKVHIQNVFIKPLVARHKLQVRVAIQNQSAVPKKVSVTGVVKPWINLAGHSIIEAPEPHWKLGKRALALPAQQVAIDPGSTKTVTLQVNVSGQLKLWSPRHPNLYGLIASLKGGAQITDKKYTRFGWRQFKIKDKKFYLNGKPIHLKGDAWHFMGIPQMSRRYAWGWYRMLKDAHANAVRLHAQPYPEFYLKMADQMGICVLDETGMWASDGGPKITSETYWENAAYDLKGLIMRDRNHPSVFGWSVSNENEPVDIDVLHAPDSLLNKQVEEIDKWVAICRKLDPTRDWVSGDGETQLKTKLPTVIGHYGGKEAIKKWSSEGKVWGIGEQGMAYYGTPKQVAKFNGNEAYISQKGRMKGLAIQAKKLLNLQKKYNAIYSSIFNIIWYGLKPLALGLRDTTKAPTLNDGIFFGPYKQGELGMQPERLGPYSATLNPGYDPRLPLYKSWPLFKAVKVSYSTDKIIPVSKNNQPKEQKSTKDTTLKKVSSVNLLSADRDTALLHILKKTGIKISKGISSDGNNLAIIDGRNPPINQKALNKEEKILEKGGTIFVWGIKPESIGRLNRFLPHTVAYTSRKSTSFITRFSDPILNGLANTDFYYTEASKKPVMNYGLKGNFVNDGKVILKASNVNWKVWNNQPEFEKTAAVIRSERESKPSGDALVRDQYGNGRVYLLSINPANLFHYSKSTLRHLFSNLGMTFHNNPSGKVSAINSAGTLVHALVLGPLVAKGKGLKKNDEPDFLTSHNTKKPEAGKRLGNHPWKLQKAHINKEFNFTKNGSSKNNTVAYMSFWIHSPRSLVNLLKEPNMPELDMIFKLNSNIQIYLNGNHIDKKPIKLRQGIVKALPLKKGWNHFVIKTMQGDQSWKIKIHFSSNDKRFLKKIMSVVQR